LAVLVYSMHMVTHHMQKPQLSAHSCSTALACLLSL
jgi:hypothetical protein